MKRRPVPGLCAGCVVFVLTACSPTGTPGLDAGTDAAQADAAEAGIPPQRFLHSVSPSVVFAAPGATQRFRLRLRRDASPGPVVTAVTAAPAGIVTVASTVTVPAGESLVDVEIRAVAAGSVTLRLSQLDPPAGPDAPDLTLPVTVTAAGVPVCPMDTRATGRLERGQRVAGSTGSALAQASVSIQSWNDRVPGTDVSIACAADQVPSGYDAVGPAVTFGPGAGRMAREIPFTLPVDATRVPSTWEHTVEIAWKGPGSGAARIVPLANTRLAPDGRSLSFDALRMGTYQAVLRRGTGSTRLRKHLTYHALVGISMGAVGTSLIGLRHPDLFDALAPMGGPADSGFSAYAIKSWVFGGFCTAAERARLGETACATASNDRVPAGNDLSVDAQNFEFFFAPAGGGTGGTFDRRARFQGFRDIARMFGNSVMPTDPANGILPLGVPASELARSDADRCATPVSLGGVAGQPRFYDDEFNPTGEFPVVTFCDGTHAAGAVGQWDGGRGNYPVEITLAVDLNRNGRRDWGEPVIRNATEPYRDVGPDGRASADEPGYDPVTNPDPSDDDYDRQYNPGGKEGNWLWDTGEPYDDVGVDGVACPSGESCRYDVGEGNGRFDTSTGPGVSTERNPRALYVGLPQADAHRLDLLVDGGIRDALQFGVNANHFAGAVAQRGEQLHVYQGFTPLVPYAALPTAAFDPDYDPLLVDYERLPRHLYVRYGSWNATMADILAGDGAHVGTTAQITARLYTALRWAGFRWPGGDRRTYPYRTSSDNAGRCANGIVCTFDFESPRARRTGQVSIALPPGYHDPENAGVRYPVVFVLHGYGMEPQGFVAASLPVGQQMVSAQLPSWQRPQKFIMVFPDGRCRTGDACLEGGFYADSPIPGGPQYETFFLDLYQWVDRTFRVRAPEDVEIVE